jgi:hypothetical protein
MTSENIDLTKHLLEFKEHGYTILKQVEQLREEIYGDTIKSQYFFTDMDGIEIDSPVSLTETIKFQMP